MDRSFKKNIFKYLFFFIFAIIVVGGLVYISLNIAKKQIKTELNSALTGVSVSIDKTIEHKGELLESFISTIKIDNQIADKEKTKSYIEAYVNNNSFKEIAILNEDLEGYSNLEESVNYEDLLPMITSCKEQLCHSVNQDNQIVLFVQKSIIGDKTYYFVGKVSSIDIASNAFKDVDTSLSDYYILDYEDTIVANSKGTLNNQNFFTALSLDEEETEVLKEEMTTDSSLLRSYSNYFIAHDNIESIKWKVVSLTTASNVLELGVDTISLIIIMGLITIGAIAILYLVFMIIENRHHHRLEKLAYYDDISTLINEKKLYLLTKNKLRKLKTKYAVISIGIMKLGSINEGYGRKIGDICIQEISKKIKSCLKNKSYVAKGSSDSFIIFTSFQSIEELKSLFNKIKEGVRIINIDKNDIEINITGGAYIIEEKNILLYSAIDRAVIARKQNIEGALDLEIYDKDTEQRIRREREIELLAPDALKNEEFLVYYQPKVDIRNDKTVGAEALVRWYHDESLIFPDEFIPLFENNGFIINFDFYILNHVCNDMARWLKENKELIKVSINFSRLHLTEANFVEKVKNVVDFYKIPHQYIEIEITENVFVENFESLISLIKELKKEKFFVSMDDFGSGYSSLNTLKDIDFDVIKLDKDFFQKGRTAKKTKIILANIINMANELGLGMICEGVETQPQINFLKEMQCFYVQGYFYSKPIPVKDFEEKFLK